MPLIPAFEIGVWNAWVLQVIFFIVLSAPSFLMSKEAKKSNNRATESIPLNKTEKIATFVNRQTIDAIEAMQITPEEKRKIFFDNAVSLLRIPL